MKLLIVNNSSSMRLIIKHTLSRTGFDNLEISEAVNGDDALVKINELQPNIVLCDWSMPKLTGIDVLKKLREDGNEVLFGFVTSEATSAMVDAAREAGAQFYIAKPFTPEKFSQEFNNVLNQ